MEEEWMKAEMKFEIRSPFGFLFPTSWREAIPRYSRLFKQGSSRDLATS